MKAVVIYYSMSGNVELAAKMIADQIGADGIELKTKKKTPGSKAMRMLWGGMTKILRRKPKLVQARHDLSAYDTVIIGAPVWAGGYATPIDSLLSETLISGKRVYLFACHMGGGAEKAFKQLTEALAGNEVKGVMELNSPKQDDPGKVKMEVAAFCQMMV